MDLVDLWQTKETNPMIFSSYFETTISIHFMSFGMPLGMLTFIHTFILENVSRFVIQKG